MDFVIAMMNKKYEILSDDKLFRLDGKVLYRIRALKDIDGAADEGDIGGYIEHEGNLSHVGNAFVLWPAQVFDNAHVSGDAVVMGQAQVFGNAKIYDDAYICGDVDIYGNVNLCEAAGVVGETSIESDKDLIWFPREDFPLHRNMTCYRGRDGDLLVTFDSMMFRRQGDSVDQIAQRICEQFANDGVDSEQGKRIATHLDLARAYLGIGEDILREGTGMPSQGDRLRMRGG